MIYCKLLYREEIDFDIIDNKKETKEEKKAPEASPEAEDKKNNDKKPGEADETK